MSQRDSQYSDRGPDSDSQVDSHAYTVPHTSRKQSEDLLQVVPQGGLNSGSEPPESSRGLMNRSPFVYDEATMVSYLLASLLTQLLLYSCTI